MKALILPEVIGLSLSNSSRDFSTQSLALLLKSSKFSFRLKPKKNILQRDDHTSE
jgi:hypothetical protein